MTEQRITIEIDDDGKITAKTAGFYGEACLDALQDLLDMEDIPAVIKPSDDYYQHRRLTKNETIQQKGGRT